MRIEELNNEVKYHKVLELEHEEMLPFVQDEFSARSWLVRGYMGLNIALVLFFVFLAVIHIILGWIGWWTLILYFFAGIGMTMTILIPIHELLHGIAYKMVGAPKVSYGVNWQAFYFYAVADRFVVGRPGIWFVALAPFVVITLSAIGFAFYVSLNYQWLLYGVIFMHTGACAGDVAILSFFERHSERVIYTYDDVKNNISYFFEQVN